MTTWSKLPPRHPCYALFRGTRSIYRQQARRVDELVQVGWVTVGRTTTLGVSMFGKERTYALDRFDGLWRVVELDADELEQETL